MEKKIIQIKAELQEIALKHKQINGFFFGQFQDAFSLEEKLLYPVMICQLLPGSMTKKNVTTSVSIAILDKITEEDFDQQTEVLSDCQQICADIKNIFSSYRFEDYTFEDSSITLDPIIEQRSDLVSGWVMNFNISSFDSQDYCAIPIENYDFENSPFVDCSTGLSPVPDCDPVTIQINSENFNSYNPGTTNDILIKDQNGNLLTGSKIGEEYIIMIQGEVRTGEELVFDNIGGAYYNEETPSNSNELTLKTEVFAVGSNCAFWHDGSGEPTVNIQSVDPIEQTPVISLKLNEYIAGQINVLIFTWTGESFIQNFLNLGELETLETPIIQITEGNEELVYDLSNIDVNATDGEFTYSSDNIAFVPVPSWTFGDTNGTLSGLTNGTEYFFKFKVTASGFNDSIEATANGTPADASIIIFEDDFTGTTLNPLKWTLNGGVSGVVITQNNQLDINVDGSQNQNVGVNAIEGVDSFDLSMTRAYSFDISSEHQDNDVGLFVGLLNPSDSPNNQISLFYGLSGANSLSYWVKDGGSNIIPFSNLTIDLTTVKTFKILVTPTTTSLHYWNGVSWTQFDTVSHTWSQTQVLSFGSGNKIGEPVSLTTIDNVFVTNADYATQYPV